MSSILLRDATPSDCDVLLELIRELAHYEKLDHEVVANKETLEESLFNAQPRAFALLAEENGIAVGFCLYFYNFSTFLGRSGIYIEDVFVRKSHRGLGIGKRFFARVAQIAKAQQCGRIEWSVLDWNQPAIDFYKNMGAVPLSEWTIHRLSENKFAALREDA